MCGGAIGKAAGGFASAATGGLIGGQGGSDAVWGTSINQNTTAGTLLANTASPIPGLNEATHVLGINNGKPVMTNTQQAELVGLAAGGAAATGMLGTGATAAGAGAGATDAALMTDPYLAGEAGGSALWAPATGAGAFDVGAAGAGVGAGVGSAAGGVGASGAASWLQTLGAGMGLAGGVMGLAGSTGGGTPNADPFAQYRGQAAQQLMALQANPNLVTQQPGYQAGLTAVERSLASQGFQGSGNMMAGLAEYGQNAYQQAIQNLMTMSGASSSPAAGAQVNAQTADTRLATQIASMNNIGSSLMYFGGGAQNPGSSGKLF